MSVTDADETDSLERDGPREAHESGRSEFRRVSVDEALWGREVGSSGRRVAVRE